MLFRRRKPATFWERVRVYLWPRRSFSRSILYLVKRVLRLTATPHAIAAGVAAGVFTSWTPFLGFHILMALVITYLVAGNMVAAAIGTAFANPLTFPLIWTSSYEVGTFILHRGAMREEHIDLGRLFGHLKFAQLWDPVLKPMLVGSLPLGFVFAAAFYALTYWGVNAFRQRRRMRMEERAKARLKDHYSGRQIV